eukprot:jgi/Picsp_1/5181/NSC_02544-R1_hypothetical protein CHLNCDRAFT_141953 [Chlorella variabilis]
MSNGNNDASVEIRMDASEEQHKSKRLKCDRNGGAYDSSNNGDQMRVPESKETVEDGNKEENRLQQNQAAVQDTGVEAVDVNELLQTVQLTPEMAALLQQTGYVLQDAHGDVKNFNVNHLDPNLQVNLGATVDAFQSLSQNELQAILCGHMYLTNASASAPSANNYKNWWNEQDEAELMRIIDDEKFRYAKLGAKNLDWARMEIYFNRSQNALRKKYWVLTNIRNNGGRIPGDGVESDKLRTEHTPLAPETSGCGDSKKVKPRAGRKQWTEEETREMAKLVQNQGYRIAEGIGNHDGGILWEELARKFHCEVAVAKRKYRSLVDLAEKNEGTIPEKERRRHFKKSIPYRWMIVSVLSKMEDLEATAPQIFSTIESDPDLSPQLDDRIMPGTKQVPRWKIQLRKVLSSDKIFVNTGRKNYHETVWKLDAQALQQAHAEKQRQDPMLQTLAQPWPILAGQPHLSAPLNEIAPSIPIDSQEHHHKKDEANE